MLMQGNWPYVTGKWIFGFNAYFGKERPERKRSDGNKRKKYSYAGTNSEEGQRVPGGGGDRESC